MVTQVVPVPGVMIFRFQAPICFVNSGVFRARLEIACNVYKNMAEREPNGCLKELFLLVSDAHYQQVCTSRCLPQHIIMNELATHPRGVE